MTANPALAISNDRLTFTMFVAAAIHALVIFGISFNIDINPNVSQTLEITLATHKSEDAPEEADFIAQHNQVGSGTEEEARQITTEQFAEFADTQINQVVPVQQLNAETPKPDNPEIATEATSRLKTHIDADRNDKPTSADTNSDQKPTLISAEIASLKAKLDRQREAYAKKPRIRRLTSVSTRSSVDAEYLHKWSQKVEFVGNKNYPKEALREELHGNLRLLAVVDANGVLIEAEILQTSGYKLLDDAALQIVHMAAPYPPFPKEIRDTTDHLEIIRTWRFEITGLSTDG
ncbi:energy transducer TonB [Marinibactrum halimedae]|uniref:Cell envelope biogenesis protein TonB n=1 Tax=Marinibactrum halimedae TaxID=1444977 RepID=A0AA37WM79_9GAMM|nr:energy transducer TonB [Marinibactrum halimedae]MCD9458323.1 TonB family protein [Marinibactrum halimedae]GLS27049.1 cell envelope biogenesis protein TonB [Marinibactrum halimedae]